MPYYKHVWTAHEVPTDDKLNHIEEGIENATNAAESGGSGGAGLPEVTTADNGDVLTVVEGAWGKAQPIMRVNLLYDAETYEYSTDKTYAEIISAFKAGMIVFLVEMYDEEDDRRYLLNRLPGENEPIQFNSIGAVSIVGGTTSVALDIFLISPTNEVTQSSYSITLEA